MSFQISKPCKHHLEVEITLVLNRGIYNEVLTHFYCGCFMLEVSSKYKIKMDLCPERLYKFS